VFCFNALVWKPPGEIYEKTYRTSAQVATDSEEKTMSKEKATGGE
jgi:hypothetical protein